MGDRSPDARQRRSWHRAGHNVTVFERSESDLVSRGAGIVAATAAWQDMTAHGSDRRNPTRLPGRLLPARHFARLGSTSSDGWATSG